MYRAMIKQWVLWIAARNEEGAFELDGYETVTAQSVYDDSEEGGEGK